MSARLTPSAWDSVETVGSNVPADSSSSNAARVHAPRAHNERQTEREWPAEAYAARLKEKEAWAKERASLVLEKTLLAKRIAELTAQCTVHEDLPAPYRAPANPSGLCRRGLAYIAALWPHVL